MVGSDFSTLAAERCSPSVDFPVQALFI